MSRRVLIISCSLCFLAGFIAGSTLQTERVPAWHATDELPSAEVASEFGQGKLMDRTLSVAPFRLYLNSANGDFAVYKSGSPVAMKVTGADDSTLAYYGEDGRISVDLVYRKGSKDLERATYTSHRNEGFAGEVRLYYVDTNGDGAFDIYTNRESGQSLEFVNDRWQPRSLERIDEG